MTFKKLPIAALGCLLVLIAGQVFVGGCGSSSHTTTITTTATNNTATISVGFGALGASGGYVNGAWTTVTVCAPNSTTNCQTIDNVLVDTGSIGLRILNSALTTVPASSLTPIAGDSAGDALQECVQYGDTSFTWGPVKLANVEVAGETAASIPIQVIEGNSYDVPSSCLAVPVAPGTPNGGNDDTLEALGGNGILGVEGYAWDCGAGCETAVAGNPYYVCPSGECGIVGVATSNQVTSPVAAFSSSDNNGVLITVPSVSATGAADGTITGSLIFGIGTQADNAFSSSVTVYGLDDYGNIPEATYNGVEYTSPDNTIILDTGSNAFYFLDATTLASVGIVDCKDAPDYYCPSTTVPFSVTVAGSTSTSGTIAFSIMNADTLFASGNSVFNDLGGDGGASASTDDLDFGLPFFLGRSVYVGMAPGLFTGETAPPTAASSAAYGYYAF